MFREFVRYSSFGGFDYDGRYYTLDDANNQLNGGLIVCERLDDDRDGRLRLHKIYANSVNERKNGWLDLYTYTRTTTGLCKGFYLCRIHEFRLDRDNYVNMVVKELIYLGEKITAPSPDMSVKLTRTIFSMDELEDKPVWEYLRGEMSPIAFDPVNHFFGRVNRQNAIEKYSSSEVMEQLLAGNVTILDEVSDALRAPTIVEEATKYCLKYFLYKEDYFKENYPLLSKKLQDIFLYGKSSRDLELLIKKKLEEFDEKGLAYEEKSNFSKVEIVLAKVEASMKYWKDFNDAKKAAEKAKRKSAKLAATA